MFYPGEKLEVRVLLVNQFSRYRGTDAITYTGHFENEGKIDVLTRGGGKCAFVYSGASRTCDRMCVRVTELISFRDLEKLGDLFVPL